MPNEEDYKIIYHNDDLEESHKAFHYMNLLEMNDDFVRDVESLRTKYSITLNNKASIDDIENEYSSILSSDDFVDDVKTIAKHIKLQGNWHTGLSLYICGQPAGASLYPDFDMHRIEAAIGSDSDEPHIVLKIYGDMTRQELEKATKNIRTFIGKSMSYESVNRLGDKTILKERFVRKYLNEGKSYKQIAELLENNHFGLQSYSDVRKQHIEFMRYVERIYQE